MKARLLIVLFFFTTVVSHAAFVTVKTGSYSSILYGVTTVLDYEIQVESASFLISGQTVPTTYFQVNARLTHAAPNMPSGYSFLGGGFSYALDGVVPPLTTVYGGGYNEPGYFNLYATTAWHLYGGIQCHVGDTLHLRSFALSTASGVNTYLPSNILDFVIPGSTTVYFLTYTLPENSTTSRRDYFATQSGLTVGGAFQVAGASAREWRIGPLSSASAVTVSLITGGLIGWDTGTGLAIPNSQTLSVVVNSGVTPLAGTGTSGGGTGIVSNPTTSTPGVTTTPGTTVTTPTGGGGGLVAVNGTSTTATGATTGDVSQVTAAVGNGANATILNATTNANGVIGAVNKSITALDKINATLEAKLGSSSFNDTNIVSGLGSVKTSVDDLKTVTQTRWTTEDAAKVAAMTAANTAATSANSSASSDGSSSASAAAGLFAAYQPPTPTALAAGAAPTLSITAPAILGAWSIDLNPFTGALSTVCSWFRTATLWICVLLFGAWFWAEIGVWVRASTQVQQAKGNTIAGTGGQVTGLVAAGLLTTAIVIAVTGILAFSFDGIGAAYLKTAMAQNAFSSMATGSLWILDQLFPVSVMLSLLIAKSAFNMYALPVFATCAAVCRFVVP